MGNPIFARVFDRYAWKNEVRGGADLRRELLAGLSGRVLEAGVGNGLNFRHYPPAVRELVAVEPEPYLRGRAEKAGEAARVNVRVVDGTAEDIPAEDATFDAVVVSGVLCSVPDQGTALAELYRVLRPGGELRFYEHVRSRTAFARWQDAADLVWPHLMGGCHVNRDTLAAIKQAGYRVQYCRGLIFPGGAKVSVVSPRMIGVARK